MTQRAWYIGATPADVGAAAILVGDRDRIDRIATLLDAPHLLPEQRGLRAVTGLRQGRRITACAFGMGAPIAAVVLHELFDLGVRSFLRIGTAMVMPPAALGDLVLADAALRGEGTSRTYAPLGFPAVADFTLNAALRRRLAGCGRTWHAGVFGSYDGFYSEMFALDCGAREPVAALRAEIAKLRLIATDMETATLLTVGRVLGARVGSLCLGTVDGSSQQKLAAAATAAGEQALLTLALDVLAETTSA